MNPKNLEELKDMASILARSGSFGAKTMESAFALMARGMSLGLPPLTALSEMHLIEGRAELSSDLMAAMILRSGLCEEWTWVSVTATRCELRTKRKGAAPTSVVWTIDRAKTAGLDGRANFKRFPEAMLRARAISELARMVYPDVTSGVYVYGEVGPEREREELPAAPQPQLALAIGEPPARSLEAPSVALPSTAPFVPTAVIAPPLEVEALAERVPPRASDLLARIDAATKGKPLFDLLREVVAEPAAWAPYAQAWERFVGRSDGETIKTARSLIVDHVPAEIRATDAFRSLGEAIEERLAILGAPAEARAA